MTLNATVLCSNPYPPVMLLCYHLLVKRDEYHSLVVKRGVCVVFCVVFCVGGALLHQLKPNIRGYTLCVEYTAVYDVIASRSIS